MITDIYPPHTPRQMYTQYVTYTYVNTHTRTHTHTDYTNMYMHAHAHTHKTLLIFTLFVQASVPMYFSISGAINPGLPLNPIDLPVMACLLIPKSAILIYTSPVSCTPTKPGFLMLCFGVLAMGSVLVPAVHWLL